MSGWGALGDVLGGVLTGQGAVDTSQAYESGRLRTAQTEDALAQARNHQLDSMSKEFKAKNAANYVDSRIAAGVPAEQAQMEGAIINGDLGANFNQYQSGHQTEIENQALGTLGDQFASPADQYRAGNVAEHKYTSPLLNQGGAIMDVTQYQPGVAPTIFNTPEAESKIAENQASAYATLHPELKPSNAADSLLDPWHGKYGKPTAGQMANPNFDESQPPSIENPAFIAQPGGSLDPEAYHPGDSRSAMYRDRIVRGAESAVATIHNLTLVPIDASKGWGMPDKGGILNTAKGNLMQNLSSDAVEQYRTMLSGLRQNLAFIEGSGLLPTGLAQSAYDALDFQEGDSLTGMTRLHKMAEYRQTIESGLMPLTYSNQVAPAVKERMKVLLAQLRKDVPFTHEDLLTLQYSKSPLQTIGDTIKQKGFAEPVTGGNPARQGAPPATGAPAATGLDSEGWMNLNDGTGRRIRYKGPAPSAGQ